MAPTFSLLHPTSSFSQFQRTLFLAAPTSFFSCWRQKNSFRTNTSKIHTSSPQIFFPTQFRFPKPSGLRKIPPFPIDILVNPISISFSFPVFPPLASPENFYFPQSFLFSRFRPQTRPQPCPLPCFPAFLWHWANGRRRRYPHSVSHPTNCCSSRTALQGPAVSNPQPHLISYRLSGLLPTSKTISAVFPRFQIPRQGPESLNLPTPTGNLLAPVTTPLACDGSPTQYRKIRSRKPCHETELPSITLQTPSKSLDRVLTPPTLHLPPHDLAGD